MIDINKQRYLILVFVVATLMTTITAVVYAEDCGEKENDGGIDLTAQEMKYKSLNTPLDADTEEKIMKEEKEIEENMKEEENNNDDKEEE